MSLTTWNYAEFVALIRRNLHRYFTDKDNGPIAVANLIVESNLLRDILTAEREAGAAEVIARVEAAFTDLICAACSGSGSGAGKTPAGRFMETDCADCDGSGGDFWGIEQAIYRGAANRSPERDVARLVRALNNVRAALSTEEPS